MITISDIVSFNKGQDFDKILSKGLARASLEPNRAYNRTTIRSADSMGKVAGYCGEFMTYVYFRKKKLNGIKWTNYPKDSICNDYDFLVGEVGIDVKTKIRNRLTELYFEASITDSSHQKCDYYVFVSVVKTDKDSWPPVRGDIVGFMSKKEYFEKATYHKKGDYDAGSGFYFKADCWNLDYKDLHPMSDLVAELRWNENGQELLKK